MSLVRKKIEQDGTETLSRQEAGYGPGFTLNLWT